MSSENNVVSIFDAKRKMIEAKHNHQSKKADGNFDVDNFFADIMKKNSESKQKHHLKDLIK